MEDKRTGVIYVLIDPRNNEVRYVGQTLSILRKRYASHCYDYKRRVCKNNSWIESLAKQGLRPIIEVIEENIPVSLIDEKEVYYIAYYKRIGSKLNNHTEGGQGVHGYIATDESKAKRLLTLKKSEYAKIGYKRQSEKLKELYKKGEMSHPTSRMTEDQMNAMRIKMSISSSKAVSSYDLNGNKLLEFSSLREAALFYGRSPSGISAVLRGKQETCGGVSWKYINAITDTNKPIINQ